jgi:hypothetical protein
VHVPYRRELAARGVPLEKVTVVMNSVDERLLPSARSAERGTASASCREAGVADPVRLSGRFLPHEDVRKRVQSAVVGVVPCRRLSTALCFRRSYPITSPLTSRRFRRLTDQKRAFQRLGDALLHRWARRRSKRLRCSRFGVSLKRPVPAQQLVDGTTSDTDRPYTPAAARRYSTVVSSSIELGVNGPDGPLLPQDGPLLPLESGGRLLFARAEPAGAAAAQAFRLR